nr:lysine-rich arabinogalactan protein 19-like [Aegilops tauschii subsp. strangulata]
MPTTAPAVASASPATGPVLATASRTSGPRSPLAPCRRCCLLRLLPATVLPTTASARAARLPRLRYCSAPAPASSCPGRRSPPPLLARAPAPSASPTRLGSRRARCWPHLTAGSTLPLPPAVAAQPPVLPAAHAPAASFRCTPCG